MEVFGIDVLIATSLAVIVMGVVQWIKLPVMNSWLVRVISLIISFAVVGLMLLVKPMTWQLYIVYSFVVFFEANGIWHGIDQAGRSVNRS